MSINHLVNPNIEPKLDIYANSITSTIPIGNTSNQFSLINMSNQFSGFRSQTAFSNQTDTTAVYNKQSIRLDGVYTDVVYFRESGTVQLSLLNNYTVKNRYYLDTELLPDLDNPGQFLTPCQSPDNVLFSKFVLQPQLSLSTDDNPSAVFITTNEPVELPFEPAVLVLEIDDLQVATNLEPYQSAARYYVELVYKV